MKLKSHVLAPAPAAAVSPHKVSLVEDKPVGSNTIHMWLVPVASSMEQVTVLVPVLVLSWEQADHIDTEGNSKVKADLFFCLFTSFSSVPEEVGLGKALPYVRGSGYGEP